VTILAKKTLSPLISAKQLTCIREERLLFETLSVEIFAGDIVQIEGANGSGKTSLLRILSGLSQPYEGKVYFQQMNIEDCREQFQQNLLYLGHLAGIKGEMSAEENFSFNTALHGNQNCHHEDYLSCVNLCGFEDSLASQLSAGQHRRIALARLYQSQAAVWILDEPFTAIDKEGVASLEALFVEHAKRGGCVIMTTHQDLMTINSSTIKKVTLDYDYGSMRI
jgi:heme exporter protein A